MSEKNKQDEPEQPEPLAAVDQEEDDIKDVTQDIKDVAQDIKDVAQDIKDDTEDLRDIPDDDEYEDYVHPLTEFIQSHRRTMIALALGCIIAFGLYQAAALVNDNQLVLEYRNGSHQTLKPGWYFTTTPFIRYNALPRRIIVKGMAAPQEVKSEYVEVVSKDGWKANVLTYVTYTLNPRLQDAEFMIANFGAVGGETAARHLDQFIQDQTRKALRAIAAYYNMEQIVLKEHVIEHQIQRLLDPAYRAAQPVNAEADERSGMAELMEIPFLFNEDLLIAYNVDIKIIPSREYDSKRERMANVAGKNELELSEERLKLQKLNMERADGFNNWLYMQMQGESGYDSQDNSP